MLSKTKNNIRQPASVGSEELHILKSNTVTLKIFKKSLFNRPAIPHRSNASAPFPVNRLTNNTSTTKYNI